MEYIFVSSLISKNKLNYILNNSNEKPLQSIQKFNRLICEGFVENDCHIKTISNIPMSRKIMKKFFWKEKSEKEDNIEYNYIPFINIKILRQITIAFGVFFIILKFMLRREKKVFICDILNTTIASITLILCKIFKVKCVGIVTDLPRDINNKSLSSKINQYFQSKYDAYIFITSYMNDVINVKGKPYIVMECIVDDKIDSVESVKKNNNDKILLYAGGLYEKYGIKYLIDAVNELDNDDIILELYGSGDLEEYIKNLNSNKIRYYGVRPNKEIVIAEQNATLLINPRYTFGDYTKYSFPSKIMEYMLSGTPVLTTKLAGISHEYDKYLYFIEDETVAGLQADIIKVLDNEDLKEKGKKAQNFVLKNKNKKIQIERVKNMIERELD